ncbi:unnamed protein product [Phyllotreta striolata]|uniref:CCDC113/CCDC96 coiled-coil domain-containing protein n=1 Tax=Phyllotreta striolata TaxID=444603 RepID=A0A9N9TVV0_PHYSR|nr:unnamed protein product [Phyllotreta striolata]
MADDTEQQTPLIAEEALTEEKVSFINEDEAVIEDLIVSEGEVQGVAEELQIAEDGEEEGAEKKGAPSPSYGMNWRESMMAQDKRITIFIPETSMFPKDESTRISGDFLPIPPDRDPYQLPTLMIDTISEEEEESIPEIQEVVERPWLAAPQEPTDYTRQTAMAKCVRLLHYLTTLRVRNTLLERSIVQYNLTKNIRNPYVDLSLHPEILESYNAKLDELNKLEKKHAVVCKIRSNEIDNLLQKREDKKNKLDTHFKQFQQIEYDIAKGLYYRKTGKPLPENKIVYYLERQKRYFQEVCELRMDLYRNKEKFAEKEKEIENLNYIDGLYLGDFEAMKLENRNFQDKIEQKDEELTVLREKCRQLGQIIAHAREKSNAMTSDLEDLQLHNDELFYEEFKTRKGLTRMKQERDKYRLNLQKLKQESGLLGETALLRDMEDSLEDVEVLRAELKQLQDTYAMNNKHLRNLRKTIEKLDRVNYVKETTKEKRDKFVKSKPKTKSTVSVPFHATSTTKELSIGVKKIV